MKRTVTIIYRDPGPSYSAPCPIGITLEWSCPTCGGQRGEPQGKRFCEDGEWYGCSVWTNPCGHIDHYMDVYREAHKEA